MNLLIVDDEIYIARALLKNINWKSIGIDQTFMAFNVEKAREIFCSEKIDILITDIEMPKESGLDLLEWVRKNGYECKVICLTCHSEFQYAQRAMRYQVSDYVLKPVDFQGLSELIGKTVKEIKEEQKQKEEQEKGILWGYHENRLETVFWQELLLGEQDTNPVVLANNAKKVNIAWDFNQQYQLVLCTVKRIYSRKKDWEENTNLMKHIVYNISTDIFLKESESNRIGWSDDQHMWLVVSAEETMDLQERLEDFIKLCDQITGIGLVVYLDEICYGDELHPSYQRLIKYDRENVFQEKGIFDIFAQKKDEAQDTGFYMEMRNLLKAKKYQEAEKLAETVWDQTGYISSRKLRLNVGAGQYEIYRCMEDNQISAEQFFSDELLEMTGKACQSTGAYKEWLQHAVKRIEELCSFMQTEKKVIVEIKQYITSHIEERISREDISQHVNFSTDYISKLFKKETGTSLSKFIMEKKMERAKELIDKREDSIGNIAIRLGYNSFSYFSEVFQEYTGVLPSEYKRINKTE